MPRSRFPPEDGETYYENARGRRTSAAASLRRTRGRSGRTPGSRSPRSAAPRDRVGALGRGTASAQLLEELRASRRGPPRPYVCELVALSPDGEELRGTGVLEGAIATERRGEEGFGYDPIFVPDGEERTVAELGNALEARALPHRAPRLPRRSGTPTGTSRTAD